MFPVSRGPGTKLLYLRWGEGGNFANKTQATVWPTGPHKDLLINGCRFGSKKITYESTTGWKLSLVYSRSIPIPIWVDNNCLLWVDDGSAAKPGLFKVDTDTNMSQQQLFTMSWLSGQKLSLIYSRPIPILIRVNDDCLLWVDNGRSEGKPGLF